MHKSLANEEEEDAKIEARRAARRAERKKVDGNQMDVDDEEKSNSDSEASEGSWESEEESEDSNDDSMTMSSFVKVPGGGKDGDVSCFKFLTSLQASCMFDENES